MCHRVTPFFLKDLEDALSERRRTGHARIASDSVVPDCYPGKQLPLFLRDGSGDLVAQELLWGFEGPKGVSSRLVFNTRLDTALRHLSYRRGMWAHALENGRCLVPVRRFFESWTKDPPHRGAEVCFEMRSRKVFLLAGVCEAGRVSIVTCEPNADVARTHSRMPLVLAPGESSVWLGPDFADLADRSGIRLVATPVEKNNPQASFFD